MLFCMVQVTHSADARLPVQMDAEGQPLGGRQLADQLEAIRQLQEAVGSPESGAGAGGHHSAASQALQGCVCSAATSTLQASILLQSEVTLAACAAQGLARCHMLQDAQGHALP